jgi:hypothetical protein
LNYYFKLVLVITFAVQIRRAFAANFAVPLSLVDCCPVVYSGIALSFLYECPNLILQVIAIAIKIRRAVSAHFAVPLPLLDCCPVGYSCIAIRFSYKQPHSIFQVIAMQY